MFAKLFGPDDNQVLVLLDADKQGHPALVVHFQAPGAGVCRVVLSYEDSARGWELAEKAFSEIDEADARRAVAACHDELELVATR